jgi:hypothetical protein
MMDRNRNILGDFALLRQNVDTGRFYQDYRTYLRGYFATTLA